MSTPTSSRLGEQQDRGGPAISGRGQGCCPVHDQDQEAEHPCQAPAQDSNAQGVLQDGQVCQEPELWHGMLDFLVDLCP